LIFCFQNYQISKSLELNIPRVNKNTTAIRVNTVKITFIIPSHIPIVARVFPASGDLPALISLISFLPMIQAGIAAKRPHIIYESIPSTRANIALELAPPPDPDRGAEEDDGGGGGGGGGLNEGGGGGGGGTFPLPES